MKRISEILLVVSLGLSLEGCTTAQPNDSNITANEVSRAPASMEPLDASDSRILTGRDRDKIELRVALRELENQLSTPAEIQQYTKAKPYLPTDKARLEFLREPGYDARERWAMNQGIYLGEYMPSSLNKSGASLRAGMFRSQVKELLGDPDTVDVAGSGRYGNERWRYSSSEPTAQGYHNQAYFIYFEAGRVVGWQNLQ